MGFIDRLGDVVGGFVEAGEDVFGLALDIATSPTEIPDDLGQIAANLFGPERGIGALIGGLPEPVRAPVGAILDPALTGLEVAYEEAISEPLAAVFTVGSLAAEDGFGSIINPSTWGEAYRIAQHRSPGQAIALLGPALFDDVDIRNPRELEDAMGSDWFRLVSGTIDATIRFTLDPAILGGKALVAARLGTLGTVGSQTIKGRAIGSVAKNLFGRSVEGDRVVLSAALNEIVRGRPGARLRSQRDIALLETRGHIDRFLQKIDGLSAARIRDIYYPNNPAGGMIAHLLAVAPDLETKRRIVRVALGSADELAGLRAAELALAGQIARGEAGLGILGSQAQMFSAIFERGVGNGQHVRSLGPGGFVKANTEAAFGAARAEIEGLYSAARLVDDLLSVWAQGPAAGGRALPGGARAALLRSPVGAWYQESVWARPLHVVFDMQPHHFVRLDSPEGDVQLARWARQSGLGAARVDEYRSAYLAARNPLAREAVLNELEGEGIRTFLAKHGVSQAEVDQLIAQSRRFRTEAQQVVKQRSYGIVGESGEVVTTPLFRTQLAESYPLADLRLLGQQARETRRLRRVDTVVERMQRLGLPIDETKMSRLARQVYDFAVPLPAQLLEGFYRVWKPWTLLRVGWPIRVVGDEQLRIMAKVDALAPLKHLGRAIRGEADEISGVRIAAAFDDDIYRQLASSDADFRRVFATREVETLDHLRGTGQFRSVGPDDVVNFPNGWERAVNFQIGQDPLGRLALAGKSRNEMIDWLRNTAEGQAHRRALPWRRDLERWVDEVNGEVARLVPEQLRDAALNQAAKYKDLQALYRGGQVPSTMVVHSEILAQTLGRGSTIVDRYNDMVTMLYRSLGAKPTNVLSRHPYFVDVYQAEMRRMINLLPDNAVLSTSQVARMEHAARNQALASTKRLLYSLAEESRMSDMLRFAMPFYNAWQEVITRWAGLAWENPAFIRQMQMTFRAPEAAGWVYDESGNKIGVDGKITDPVEGGPWKVGDPAVGSDRFIQVRVPKWVRDHVPGLKDMDTVTFDKSGFNMVLAGPPGFGPAVQLPVSSIVLTNPRLEDALRFILPYGATTDLKGLLLPTQLRRLNRAFDESDRARQNQTVAIYYTKLVDYELGRRPDLEGLDKGTVQRRLLDEANDESDKFHFLKFAAGFFSPVALQYQSPYQAYIDAYRARQEWDRQQRAANPAIEADPSYLTPDEWFMAEFGPEYFALTEPLTKSLNGVPPTIEGFEAQKRYDSLLERYPEIGGLIIGAEGAGEFNRTVYEIQLRNGDRRVKTFEERLAGPDVRAGWLEYRSVMDRIDSVRLALGLPNFQVAEAAWLRAWKRAEIDRIARTYQGWADEFFLTDGRAWDRRIAGMRALVEFPEAQDRPEIRALGDYLEMRDLLLELLRVRSMAGGAGTLTAESNRDLRVIWDAMVTRMIDGSNPQFADLYYRWLEHDPVARPLIAEAA